MIDERQLPRTSVSKTLELNNLRGKSMLLPACGRDHCTANYELVTII